MVLHEPGDTVGCAILFVGGERQNQIARGDVAFPLQADEGGDQGRVHGLDVLGAAPVEVTVLPDELEGVGSPVFRTGLDNVEVADEQLGLQRAVCGSQASDQIALVGASLGDEDLHVGCGEPGSDQMFGACASGCSVVASRVCRVDGDQFREDVAGRDRHLGTGV